MDVPEIKAHSLGPIRQPLLTMEALPSVFNKGGLLGHADTLSKRLSGKSSLPLGNN